MKIEHLQFNCTKKKKKEKKCAMVWVLYLKV